MGFILGIYGVGQSTYGEDMLSFFDFLLDKYRPGPMTTVLTLADKPTEWTPKYDTLKNKSTKYKHIENITIFPEWARMVPENPDVALHFALENRMWLGWIVGVYVGRECDARDEVLTVLQHLKISDGIRYGFCKQVREESLPTVIIHGVVGGDLRAPSMAFGRGGHLKDQMRDICELNILSNDHLQRPVGAETLREWIESGARGSLNELREGLWAWERTSRMAIFG